MTPGPSVFLVIAQSIQKGLRSGAMVVAGVMAANTVFFVLSAFGFAAALATWPELFQFLKIVGASYLVYIAITTLWTLWSMPVEDQQDTRVQGAVSGTGDFLIGFLTNITNIKTIVIFVSIVPQFIHTDFDYTTQFIALGAISTVVETPILLLYAGFAANFSQVIRKGSCQSYLDGASAGVLLLIAGGLFIGSISK